eukprot:GHVQ01018184.1.p1 GENE.GHVQ01018184.1~~GHVQ01018184.1.p1  ORF type:complete len:386 (+),score=72.26 GHVQ01018184.1:217-1374(+)
MEEPNAVRRNRHFMEGWHSNEDRQLMPGQPKGTKAVRNSGLLAQVCYQLIWLCSRGDVPQQDKDHHKARSTYCLDENHKDRGCCSSTNRNKSYDYVRYRTGKIPELELLMNRHAIDRSFERASEDWMKEIKKKKENQDRLCMDGKMKECPKSCYSERLGAVDGNSVVHPAGFRVIKSSTELIGGNSALSLRSHQNKDMDTKNMVHDEPKKDASVVVQKSMVKRQDGSSPSPSSSSGGIRKGSSWLDLWILPGPRSSAVDSDEATGKVEASDVMKMKKGLECDEGSQTNLGGSSNGSSENNHDKDNKNKKEYVCRSILDCWVSRGSFVDASGGEEAAGSNEVVKESQDKSVTYKDHNNKHDDEQQTPWSGSSYVDLWVSKKFSATI